MFDTEYECLVAWMPCPKSDLIDSVICEINEQNELCLVTHGQVLACASLEHIVENMSTDNAEYLYRLLQKRLDKSES